MLRLVLGLRLVALARSSARMALSSPCPGIIPLLLESINLPSKSIKHIGDIRRDTFKARWLLANNGEYNMSLIHDDSSTSVKIEMRGINWMEIQIMRTEDREGSNDSLQPSVYPPPEYGSCAEEMHGAPQC